MFLRAAAYSQAPACQYYLKVHIKLQVGVQVRTPHSFILISPVIPTDVGNESGFRVERLQRESSKEGCPHAKNLEAPTSR